MARSRVIYAVSVDNLNPYAFFTVKHEALAFIARARESATTMAVYHLWGMPVGPDKAAWWSERKALREAPMSENGKRFDGLVAAREHGARRVVVPRAPAPAAAQRFALRECFVVEEMGDG